MTINDKQTTQSDFVNDPGYQWIMRLRAGAQEEIEERTEGRKRFVRNLWKPLMLKRVLLFQGMKKESKR